MKTYFLTLVLLLTFSSAHAQMNEAEAMAAYMLSEEDYNNGKYTTALTYLNSATEKLGETNSKILYLKTMILLELAKTDPVYYEQILSTIEQFENAPDAKEFNQEKVLEVMKTKLRVHELQVKLAEDAAAKKEAERKFEVAFEKLSQEYLQDLPYPYPYDKLKSERDDKFIRKAKKTFNTYIHPDFKVIRPSFILNHDGVFGIYVQADTVKGYDLKISLAGEKYTAINGKKEFDRLFTQFNQELGAYTRENNFNNADGHNTTYVWTVKNRVFYLRYVEYYSGKRVFPSICIGFVKGVRTTSV